jgi:hypothetical protein
MRRRIMVSTSASNLRSTNLAWVVAARITSEACSVVRIALLFREADPRNNFRGTARRDEAATAFLRPTEGGHATQRERRDVRGRPAPSRVKRHGRNAASARELPSQRAQNFLLPGATRESVGCTPSNTQTIFKKPQIRQVGVVARESGLPLPEDAVGYHRDALIDGFTCIAEGAKTRQASSDGFRRSLTGERCSSTPVAQRTKQLR